MWKRTPRKRASHVSTGTSSRLFAVWNRVTSLTTKPCYPRGVDQISTGDLVCDHGLNKTLQHETTSPHSVRDDSGSVPAQGREGCGCSHRKGNAATWISIRRLTGFEASIRFANRERSQNSREVRDRPNSRVNRELRPDPTVSFVLQGGRAYAPRVNSGQTLLWLPVGSDCNRNGGVLIIKHLGSSGRGVIWY